LASGYGERVVSRCRRVADSDNVTTALHCTALHDESRRVRVGSGNFFVGGVALHHAQTSVARPSKAACATYGVLLNAARLLCCTDKPPLVDGRRSGRVARD